MASSLANQKHRVYLNEYNLLMENVAYFPIATGLLRAYAETSETLTDNYEFMPFIFYRDTLESILARYENPSVAGFSLSTWNEQLNLKVAEEVKRMYPDCLIVFGGPSVPHHPHDYFQQHPFVDVTVRSEGEEAFSEILSRFLESRDFGGIHGVSYRDPNTGECVRNEGERPQPRDLDVYPSPYLEGMFDDLIAQHQDIVFQQIIETNRGCPFLCTFCFWGQGGLSRKYRYHGLDRTALEIEWAAKHKILYLYNADSNFGMHTRDAEIAQMLVDTKAKYGYPDKFRTTYGKNTDDKIFNVAKLLHDHDIGKGVTLARQSNDEQVLINIKRDNIKMETYENLQIRFNEANIPVYSELILGLPGETYQTWTDGIEELLQSGLKNQLLTYMCQVYPNTDLHDPEYQKEFGIVTHRIPLTQVHGRIREGDLVTEYEDIIIGTNTMSVDEWRKMRLFSWVTMLLHGMKLAYFVLYYLNDRHDVGYSELIDYITNKRMAPRTGQIFREEVEEFEAQIDRILDGQGRGRETPGFGDVYWHEEEASFLRISHKLGEFYDQMLIMLREFMVEKGLEFEEVELQEVVQYQRMRIPSYDSPAVTELQFTLNIPEYFETALTADAKPLTAEPQLMTIDKPNEFKGNKPEYAVKTIFWGRNSNTMLADVTWKSANSS